MKKKMCQSSLKTLDKLHVNVHSLDGTDFSAPLVSTTKELETVAAYNSSQFESIFGNCKYKKPLILSSTPKNKNSLFFSKKKVRQVVCRPRKQESPDSVKTPRNIPSASPASSQFSGHRIALKVDKIHYKPTFNYKETCSPSVEINSEGKTLFKRQVRVKVKK